MSAARYYNPTMRRRILAGDEPLWLKVHPRRTYIRAANLSTPEWVDREHLKRIHAWAQFISITTGVYHVVDHIVPLSHPDVCGLGVPCNLRVITYAQNAAKSNTWNPWQMELPLC